jgi:hypothetical protein
MPTILLIMGWRLFFYANEGNEPIHVHCQKGDTECKYWLDRENFNVEEAFAFNLSPKGRREIRQIIMNMLSILKSNGLSFKGGCINENL